MKAPAARWTALLAGAWMTAVATSVAAAAERFVPRDPGFVVANITQTMPDQSLRTLLSRWRDAPTEDAPAVALARALMERARLRREPRYFGRAEAVLAPRALRPRASAETRRLYAETLQFRHAFAPAEALLDELLKEQSNDSDARLQRGSLRLTRGDFAGARADCSQLALARGPMAAAGFACLAEALAGGGELERGRLLLDAMTADSSALEPAVRAYLLTTRAELAERAGDLAGAVRGYRAASRLSPDDDSIRAALVDALVEAHDADASTSLRVDNPSLALLVRAAALASTERPVLVRRARSWLQLEAARGDSIHHREAALLALAERQPVEALAQAQRNFEYQRELADVRVLARAAVSARDARSAEFLRRWLKETGYEDAITRRILAGGPRG